MQQSLFKRGDRALTVPAENGYPREHVLAIDQVVEVLEDQVRPDGSVLVLGEGRFSFKGQEVAQWVDPKDLRKL